MKRREFVKLIGLSMAGPCFENFDGRRVFCGETARRKNVLFVAVDDLRPELGCYGNRQIISPNIDRLADEGVVFKRAYCQQAACNPSRASLMTGLRPDSSKVWDLCVHFRDTVPNVVTIPQHFRANGYYAAAYGKIFHSKLPDRRSWDEPNHWPKGTKMWSKQGLARLAAYRENMRAEGKSDAEIARMRGPATEDEDVPDNRRIDGALADGAIGALKELAKGKQPFFLGVGFILPHLPFVPPKKYWDMYDPSKIDTAENTSLPEGSPAVAMNTMYELRDYMDFAETARPGYGLLSEAQQRRLKHGYYASVTFIDAQIGRLFDTLDDLGIRKDTIIVLWGDHGCKLGEHGSWGKQTNYEIDALAPLIVCKPGAKGNGSTCDSLVEFVDIYPTLCDLADLEKPGHLEGQSLTPLLEDVERTVKDAAVSQLYRRRRGVEYMGYAMMTSRYRYIEWRHWDSGEIVEWELYDHKSDPGENVNVAEEAKYAARVKKLRKQLGLMCPRRGGGHPTGLRSRKSQVKAKLTVVNVLKEKVTVYWLDFFGARKKTRDIQAGQQGSQNTFVGHVFVVESASGRYHQVIEIDGPEIRVEVKMQR
jgi:iduronate 2-sulfatase